MRNFLNLLVLIILFSWFGKNLYAQSGQRGSAVVVDKGPEIKGITYAVIIGISTYQNIQKLQFADRDAHAFYDFLISKSGGSVDSNNIDLLLNSKARRANMNYAINKWLYEEKNPGKGDKVYIYFAGHGDAIPGISSFLLGWDVPSTGDPNVDYEDNGGIMIETLKRRIKLMSDNGASVILITDACRGNESLSGGEKGQDNLSKDILANDMEMKAGELQFASCSTGEVSREDKTWGGGRGLFSYWFVNGLYGLADKDGDGIVSAGELSEYVTAQVKLATKRTDANGQIHYDQKPFFCCTENADDMMAKVDPEKKQVIEEAVNTSGKENEMIAFASARGINNEFFKLSEKEKSLYNKFENQIQNDTSITTDWKGYVSSYTALVQDNLSAEFSSTLRDELIIALYDHSQQVMNFYLEAKNIVSDSASQNYFSTAVTCLDTALTLMDKNDELSAKIKRNKLILEVLTTIHSSSNAKVENKYISQKLIDAALKNLNMAKALNPKPSAILSHTYALLYQYQCNYREAINLDKEAIKIAPKWTFALTNLGNLYDYIYQYDSAAIYYRKALSFDSSYTYSLMGLGHIYFKEKNYTSAESFYLKAFNSDSTNISLLHEIEYFYKAENKFDKMQQYYLTEASLNPEAYKNLGDFYNTRKKFTDAEKYYTLYLKSDSANILTLSYISNFCYRQKEYTDAGYYCRKIVQLDPKNTDALSKLGYIYFYQKQYDESELNFNAALQIDNSLLSALLGMGNLYEDQKNYSMAEDYYYKALKKTPSFAYLSYRLACCFALQNDIKKSIKNLEKSINDGNYDYENMQTDSDLSNIRNTGDFKDLMKKYFPEKLKE